MKVSNGGRHHGYFLSGRTADARSGSGDVAAGAVGGGVMGLRDADVPQILDSRPDRDLQLLVEGLHCQVIHALAQERSGRLLGVDRLLNDQQTHRLQHFIDGHGPEDRGLAWIASVLWWRRAARDMILEECAVRLPVRTVANTSRDWATPPSSHIARRVSRCTAGQRPGDGPKLSTFVHYFGLSSWHAKGQAADQVHVWLAETCLRIKARASKENDDIFRRDKSGEAADEYSHVGYARQEEPASLLVPGSHIRINLD